VRVRAIRQPDRTAQLPARVRPSSNLGKAMTAAAATLDRYNNGRLTTICLP
jgi:hypothetical protein